MFIAVARSQFEFVTTMFRRPVKRSASNRARNGMAAFKPDCVIRRPPFVIFMPRIGAPFVDVAIHAPDAPRVRTIPVDGRVRPGRCSIGGPFVTPPIARGRSGPTGVFRLGLARQAITFTCDPLNPIGVGICIVPGRVDDRPIGIFVILTARQSE